jgi:hypothetical protein
LRRRLGLWLLLGLAAAKAAKCAPVARVLSLPDHLLLLLLLTPVFHLLTVGVIIALPHHLLLLLATGIVIPLPHHLFLLLTPVVHLPAIGFFIALPHHLFLLLATGIVIPLPHRLVLLLAPVFKLPLVTPIVVSVAHGTLLLRLSPEPAKGAPVTGILSLLYYFLLLASFKTAAIVISTAVKPLHPVRRKPAIIAVNLRTIYRYFIIPEPRKTRA